ncbi:DEAD/DEAH box helicase [Pedobacter sp. BMA]|uniref:DEAD/DEAH box helicase n=1 Tax=Pedobacter sp. BMA TaxID=1663685 RepID=UPI00069CE851|nr:DEAD/DEAH box helicase [Pedobacter sp. BMA]
MTNRNSPRRNASTPYKLQLKAKTQLPYPADVMITDEMKKEKYPFCDYSVTAFEAQTITVRSGWQEYHEQKISMMDGYIMVSCNCAKEVTGLCSHAIKLFNKMIDRKEFKFFERFKQHPFTDPEFFEKYLVLKGNYSGISVLPKREYGHIFNYQNAIRPEAFMGYPAFSPLPVKTKDEELTSVAYIVGAQRDLNIPMLIPCRVILYEYGDGIRSFVNFYKPVFADKRLNLKDKLLHAYSQDFDLLLNFETEYKQSRYVVDENTAALRYTAFNYWKQLLPVLKEQKHLFYHTFYNKVLSKATLTKDSMTPFAFTDEEASFIFTLSQHSGHYKLRVKARLKGQDCEINEVLPNNDPFFFSLKQSPGLFHQFHNLEEGKAISEILRAGGTFTVLDKDFEEFNQAILVKLALNFQVRFELTEKANPTLLNIQAKQIRTVDQGEFVAFIPEVIYPDGLVVTVQSAGTEFPKMENGQLQVLQRNKAEEAAFKALFIALLPTFKQQEALPYFYLTKDTLKRDHWFARTIYNLKGPDINFSGLENLTGIDFHMELPDIDLNIQQENGSLDIGVSVTFGNLRLSPEEIQKAIRKGADTLVLANGKTAHLPKEFFKKLGAIFSSGTITDKGVKLTGQHYMLIDHLYKKAERPDLANMVTERDKLFNELEKIPLIPVPDNLNAVLRPYQLIGFSWLCHLHSLKWGGLLADDMGLGKTLQILTLLQHLKNNGLVAGPHLLLAPASLLYNWQDEAAKFFPELKVLVFHGLLREKNSDELKKYDLVITSYGTAAVDIEFLKAISFDYVILDEAQAIKNPYSKKYKMATLLAPQHRLALTGTPVENSSSDLYALMNFVNPGFFGSMRMFNDNLAVNGDDKDKERADTLLKMTRPFILRRTKKQVATDLPPKTEMTIWCEMEPGQRRIYDSYSKEFKAELVDKIASVGLENSKFEVLRRLMALRQICNSPALIKDAPSYEGTPCKITELMEHIMEKTTGHKLLVFSAFTGMLGLIKAELEQQGITYAYLDGSTKLDKRKAAVNRFQNDEDCRVFLISLKAGGTGLNLTAADYVYLIDPWWNPAVENQAIDRCYRIGQDKHVMAYRMICKDTLEERILEIQERKRKLAGELIPGDDGILKSLGKEDLLKLFG